MTTIGCLGLVAGNNQAMKVTAKAVSSLVLLAIVLATARVTEAQRGGNIPRIGMICMGSCTSILYTALRQRLADLGYVEGQNVFIEQRSLEGRYERLAGLAAELVEWKPDIILVGGSARMLHAVKEVSDTIPIVFVTPDDPVRAGVVASLPRPAANITGFTSLNTDLNGKRIAVLKEAMPRLASAAVLFDYLDPMAPAMWRTMDIAARSLKVRLQRLDVRGSDDVLQAMETATKRGANALVVAESTVFFIHQTQIVDLAAKKRLPTVSPWRELPEAGGLMSYGVNIRDMFRRAASYIDKILKGVKPADLPVERTIRIEMVVNLKAAKEIGLKIPPEVLQRADTVIR